MATSPTRSSSQASPTVQPGMSVREILARYPSAEAVFERHGLLGCGGPNGPLEPVGFFARVHRVDPGVLLAELNEQINRHSAADAQPVVARPPAVTYPLFVVTSLVIAISAGFTTGIIALAAAALNQPIPGVSWLILIQTHGRLQLFGWAGLFVFGVAYHIVPRFVTTPIALPRLAQASYWLIVGGLALSLAQMTTGGDFFAFHLAFALGLAFLLLAAVSYAVVIGTTVRASEQPISLPIRFVVTGSIWLVLGAALQLVVGSLSQAGQPIQSPTEEPALEAILEGFLLVTALGVSLQTLPVFAGLAPTRDKILPATFVIVLAGLIGLVGGAALAGDFGQVGVGEALAAMGAIIFFGAVVAYVWAIRLFEPANLPVAEMGTGHGWARAVRFAYAWLLIGLALQAETTVRALITATPVTWSMLGAARHALALGFVTLLIVGMASRVIPVFAGKPLWKPWLVDLAAGLLVLSVALRVALEVFAPYGTSTITGLFLTLSGPLALAGLIVFALNFTMTMTRRTPAALSPSTTPRADLRRPLRGEDLLADALQRPGGLSVLLNLGLSFLADPAHRAIAARSLTIAQAARRADQDPGRILAALNQTADLVDDAVPAVDPDQTVAAILDRWPATLAVFIEHGFTPLAQARLRAQLAPTITIRQAAASRGVDLTRLLADLHEATARPLATSGNREEEE